MTWWNLAYCAKSEKNLLSCCQSKRLENDAVYEFNKIKYKIYKMQKNTKFQIQNITKKSKKSKKIQKIQNTTRTEYCVVN